MKPTANTRSGRLRANTASAATTPLRTIQTPSGRAARAVFGMVRNHSHRVCSTG